MADDRPDVRPNDVQEPNAVNDLAEAPEVAASDEARVKGGALANYAKTPSPTGPIPIPYPNVGR